MKLTNLDPTDELSQLLSDYGCSATNGGFRRLAVLLALEAGKLHSPEFTPHHDDVLKLNSLALLADAVTRPGMSKTSIAHATHAAAMSMGFDQYSTPTSVRAVLGKYEAEARACAERARAKNRLPPEMEEKPQLTTLDLAALFPTQGVGQARLDDWWVSRLTRAGKDLSAPRSGTYFSPSAIAVSPDTRLIGVAVVEDDLDHPEGTPRFSDAAPVRAIFEIGATYELPGDAGPILHRRTDRVTPPPRRCLLSGNAWGWSGTLESGLQIQMRGIITNEGLHSKLLGDMTVIPAKDRSWRQPIECLLATGEAEI